MSKIKSLGPGVRPRLRSAINQIQGDMGLPFIWGQWYFVNPETGANTSDGKTVATAVADLETAYGLATTGDGDGIALLSSGTSTANTTSYIDEEIAWSKWGITVYGVASGARYASRARIASKERTTGALTTIAFNNVGTADTITDSAGGFLTAGFEAGQKINVVANSGTNDGDYTILSVVAGTITVSTGDSLTTEDAATAGSTTVISYNVNNITVSGSNNSFLNVSIGNYGSAAAAIGCLEVTGNRNYFGNCHILGMVHATPGAVADAYDVKLNAAEENTFEACTIGSDTIIRAAANSNILVDGGCWRNNFYDCDFVNYSATAGHGWVNSADATSMSGTMVVSGSRVINWNPNGLTALTSAFIGTKPTSGYILVDSTSLQGFAAWDSVGGNNTVYVGNADATASGAGGIATTV